MSTPVILHSTGLFRTEVQAGPHHWVLDEPVASDHRPVLAVLRLKGRASAESQPTEKRDRNRDR